MGKSDTFRNILIAASLFMIVMAVAPRIFPPPPMPQERQTGVGDSENAPLDADRTQWDPSTTTTSQQPADTTLFTDGYVVHSAEETETISLGASIEDGIDKKHPGPYRMRLVLSNIGASIESAYLTDHAETIEHDDRYELLSSIERPNGTTYRSFVIEKINVDGVDIALDNQRWFHGLVEPYSRTHQDKQTEEGKRIHFWIEIHKDNQPALKLTRVYEIPKQEVVSGRHDLRTNITIENLSDQIHQVVLTTRGGMGVRLATMRGGGPFVDYGMFAGDGNFIGSRTTYASITSSIQPTTLFQTSREDPDQRFSWVATANTYFTCTIAPLDEAGQGQPVNIAEVAAIDVDADTLTTDDASVILITRAETLQPNGKLSYPSDIFIGEKDGHAFKTIPDYISRNYNSQITSGYSSCTFTWLIDLMIWLLNSLYSIIPDYGLAIIIMVMIVRTLLHPITKKGQVNMVRMQQQMGEFSPKIEELKKKFANDKARIQQETMKLYREHGINPAGQFLTCMPMVIQMPIWFALFLSLSNNIGMRHQPVNFTWINDLTAPDAMITFSSPLPLIGATFNLLPLLVSVFMYTQQKLQPKPKPNPNATDQQKMQQDMMQKMMPMMSIMMLFIFYKMPSGLNLYIMFSSIFGTIEQYRIRKHIKDQEEKGTLHKPKPKPKEEEDVLGRKPKPKKPSFFEKMQKMADEAQKKQAKQRGKQKRRR